MPAKQWVWFMKQMRHNPNTAPYKLGVFAPLAACLMKAALIPTGSSCAGPSTVPASFAARSDRCMLLLLLFPIQVLARSSPTAPPNKVRYYSRLPTRHLPGLFWGHPHKHGSTTIQVRRNGSGLCLLPLLSHCQQTGDGAQLLARLPVPPSSPFGR